MDVHLRTSLEIKHAMTSSRMKKDSILSFPSLRKRQRDLINVRINIQTQTQSAIQTYVFDVYVYLLQYSIDTRPTTVPSRPVPSRPGALIVCLCSSGKATPYALHILIGKKEKKETTMHIWSNPSRRNDPSSGTAPWCTVCPPYQNAPLSTSFRERSKVLDAAYFSATIAH